MDDIENIRKLAGVGEWSNEPNHQSYEQLSREATEKRQIERERNIKPGDQAWFDLWFKRSQQETGQMPAFRGRQSR
jgi:hypothetical protein